jgi:hypothetical protein
MKNLNLSILSIGFVMLLTLGQCTNPQMEEKPVPKIEKRGEATQLIVDGEPFLVLGGELHNSSSSSREYMKDIWPMLETMNLNTILAVVEWSLVEPVEGQFDFSIVDELIEDARAHNIRLSLLWFGAWKNGQSHYMPGWVKEDYTRFPRVMTSEGKSLEILSTFEEETMGADARAFAAMMKHVKEMDSKERTVIMIQVQNEVGILGSSRDYSEAGNAAFNSLVPADLMRYLSENKDGLLPELLDAWSASNYAESGTWEEVFGSNTLCDEIFMAWNYARYINYSVIKGKEQYDLPMFVNAWIVQPEDRLPGDYPSGGPQSHVLDLWRAGAPNIDLLCPDIYLPNFAEICALYTRSENALFIPESRAGEQGVGQLFYAIGKHSAIGYSPFGIEGRVMDPDNDPIPKAYKLLQGMASVILEAQQNGTIDAVLLKKEINPMEEIIAGDYKLHVELRKTRRSDFVPEQGYALIIALGPDEFILTGKDVQISFSPAIQGPAVAAILQVDEGSFENGAWIPRRRLNGDAIMLEYDLATMAAKDMTGTGIRFSGEDRNIQRVKLYRYE